MRGADVLVSMLIAYDVKVVFGVPGDTNVPLYDALRLAQDRVRHVMARDERSAGYMADAYSRLSNKPGIVECPSGAGATYTLPAVAEANGSSVPMVLITADTPLSGEGRGVITELDCAKLFEPVTKGSWQVKSAAKIPEIVRRAFRLACGGKPGAVHLAIPEDVLSQKVDPETISLHAETACAVFPAYRSGPSAGEVSGLVDLIRAADRPVFVAGGGVNRSQAGPLLLEVAERLGMPVVNTITGQSAIPDHHPLAIGVVGDNGFHPHANRALEEADLIVYWGCKVGSVVTVGWTFPSRRDTRKVAQVDIDPVVLGNNTDNVLSLVGDARFVLERLAEVLPAEIPDDLKVDPKWPALLNRWRGEFWEHARTEMNDDSLPIRPQRIVRSFGGQLTRPYSIFSDPGTPTPHMTRLLRLSEAGSTFIIPRAFGGLGYAIPAVVGGWLAKPGVRPIGLFGDGSFGMSVGELETVTRLRVPALLIHFNNACYGWIKALQRLHGHNSTYSVDFTPLNAAKIAEAFGFRAWRISRVEDLDPVFAEAFAHDGPAFIDIVVESIADVAPPVFSWLRRVGQDPLAIPPAARVRLTERSAAE